VLIIRVLVKKKRIETVSFGKQKVFIYEHFVRLWKKMIVIASEEHLHIHCQGQDTNALAGL
jgi:hypothetical protein